MLVGMVAKPVTPVFLVATLETGMMEPDHEKNGSVVVSGQGRGLKVVVDGEGVVVNVLDR